MTCGRLGWRDAYRRSASRWKALCQWWRSEDTSQASLASTGVVAWASVVVVAGVFVWKHPSHRVDGVAVTVQLLGVFLTAPILVRKLLPRRPLVTASFLAGDSSPAGSERRWMERGAFRLASANLVRAGFRRWRSGLGLGAALVTFALAVIFLAPASDFAAILVAVFLTLGSLLFLLSLYAMVIPRRFHIPLPPETEILSPLQLVANERIEGVLGVIGLAFVLGSIVLRFVALYI
jgi:hypothetical protein